MINIVEAKKALATLNEAQAKIGDMKQYINLSYEDMFVVYKLMKPKQAEKFIEDWVANLIGGRKVNKTEAPLTYSKCDLGDIQLSKNPLDVGKNNIELKVSFNMGSPQVGGGQLRFFEPIAGYMFFKAIDDTRYEMFLLSKDQLVKLNSERYPALVLLFVAAKVQTTLKAPLKNAWRD